jgi:preprotein translocase subunit YajC
MESTGWEMRPAGWILLFILAMLLTYFMIRWLQRRSDKNLDKLG